MKVTDCTCTEPGWCERHQCHKAPLWFLHCQRRPDFFAAWEAGGLRELCDDATSPARRNEPCRHLGEERRQVTCPTCHGSVRLKVFGCEVFQECVRGLSVEGLTSCVICPRYDPREAPNATTAAVPSSSILSSSVQEF